MMDNFNLPETIFNRKTATENHRKCDFIRAGKLCLGRNITSRHAVYCRRKDLEYRVEQMLWPDHCINNTPQAQPHPNLTVKPTDVLISKKDLCQVGTPCAHFTCVIIGLFIDKLCQ